jgi:hypothetical protein
MTIIGTFSNSANFPEQKNIKEHIKKLEITVIFKQNLISVPSFLNSLFLTNSGISFDMVVFEPKWLRPEIKIIRFVAVAIIPYCSGKSVLPITTQ